MRNPFVGLRPFQPEDSSLYFGRDRDVAVLQNLVITIPVLVVYAPSGTGKSSLLNAGLLPVLKADPELLPVLVGDPFQDVSEFMQQQLARSGWADSLPAREESLAQYLERHLAGTGRRVVLVLDQFEERLKDPRTESELFAEIARLANTRSEAATTIISIREDYLGGLEKLMRRVTGLLDASYRVPNMPRTSLAEAVHGPLGAADAGFTVEDGLVAEVLTDLEREGAQPESIGTRMPGTRAANGHIEPGYFQVVWSHLWAKDAASGKMLTKATYDQEGRATGILKSFVTDTISQLPPFEAEALYAAIRYLVLPTAAKVSLTIDDLLGLLRADDFSRTGRILLFGGTRPRQDSQLLEDSEKEVVNRVLESLFYHLTRAEAPLFRRVVRSGREEYELVHDLLGLILLQWRMDYNFDSATAAVREILAGTEIAEPDEDGRRPKSSARKIAIRHGMRQIKDDLTAYLGQFSNEVAAREAGEYSAILRSALREAHVVQRAVGLKSAVQSDRELLDTIDKAKNALRLKMHEEARSDAQGEWQAQDYALLRIRSGLSVLSQSSISFIPAAMRFVFSAVLAVSGLYLANSLVDQIWHVSDIQYKWLTLDIVAIAATFMYMAAYSDNRDSWPMLRAVRATLFPVYKYATSSPTGPMLWKIGQWALVASSALTWWPIMFILFVCSYQSVAALFGLFGWSPTAGFNIGAIAAAIIIGVFYVVVVDL